MPSPADNASGHRGLVRAAALHALRTASGRRARRFAVQRAANDVAEHMTDWRPLRDRPAFQRFEHDLRAALLRLEAAPKRR